VLVRCAASPPLPPARCGGDTRPLKARFGSHEVINTIMLNFVAVALVGYLRNTTTACPAIRSWRPRPSAAARTSTAGRLHPGLPARIPLNIAFLLALLSCWLVYVLLWKTKWGYEIRATGQNPAAAEYGGRVHPEGSRC